MQNHHCNLSDIVWADLRGISKLSVLGLTSVVLMLVIDKEVEVYVRWCLSFQYCLVL